MFSRRFWSLLVPCVCAAVAPAGAHALVHHPSSADLTAALTPPSGPVYVGQQLSVTGTVTNLGPLAAYAGGSARIQGLGKRRPPGVQWPSCCGVPASQLAPGQSTAATWRDLYVKGTDPIVITLTAHVFHGPASDPNAANNVATFTITPQIGRCTSPVPTSRFADRIFGTVGGEVVNSGAGSDLIRTGDGDDCVNGGPGSDTIAGGTGDDLLRGGSGADTISGGPGKDKISGDAGNDTINAADGERDVVNCGAGKDKVKADKIDSLRQCERVRFVH